MFAGDAFEKQDGDVLLLAGGVDVRKQKWRLGIYMYSMSRTHPRFLHVAQKSERNSSAGGLVTVHAHCIATAFISYIPSSLYNSYVEP
jgi:hypothetical protein